MKELNRTTRLILLSAALILVLLTGYLTMYRPAIVYRLHATEVLSKVCDTARMISPPVLSKLMGQKDVRIMLIDVRSRDEYDKGHIGNAINIPVRELLDQDKLRKIKALSKSHARVILYGDDLQEASSPCLLLFQLGMENLTALQGGYEAFIHPFADSQVGGNAASYVPEVSRVDVSVLNTLKSSGSQPAEKGEELSASKKETVKPVKKHSTGGGGC